MRTTTSKPALVLGSAAALAALSLGSPAAAGPDTAGAAGDNGRHLGQSKDATQTAPGGPARAAGDADTKTGKAGPKARGKAGGNPDGRSNGKSNGRSNGKAGPKGDQQRPEQAASDARRGASPERAPGAGRSQDPLGNNGTVKIAGLGDLDRIPNNVPHPGCTFQVEWYGFDQGDDVVSTVRFTAHAPTAGVGLTVNGPTQVPVGGDPASGAGTATGLDGVATYTLGFAGAPHPKQGYHVRLTVSTPRSQGNDTKTKMFWVEPCTTSAPGNGVTTGPVVGGTVATAPQPAAATSSARPQPVTPSVLGITATRGAAPVPLAVEAGDNESPLGGWSSGPGWALVAAIGGLLAGAGALLRLRRRA